MKIMMCKRCYTYWILLLLFVVIQVRCGNDELTDADYDAGDYDLSEENFNSKSNDEKKQTEKPKVQTSHETYDGNEEQNDTSKVATSLTTQPSTTQTMTTTTDVPFLAIENTLTSTVSFTDGKCPQGCRCYSDFDVISCEGMQLTEIPKNLPRYATQINLSNNRLSQINVSDLIECNDLRDLLLDTNQIETIVDHQAFELLPNLVYIDFSSNALKPLHGDEFSYAKNLKNLSLAHNANIVVDNVPILNVSTLQTLNLAHCNITELSDNIFEHLPSLISVNLRGNPLDTNLNIHAFDTVGKLQRLQLPNVDRKSVIDLCKTLENIDEIRMESFSVSCFELVSGSTFEESINPNGQTSQIDSDSNDLYKVVTTATIVETILSPMPTTIRPHKKVEVVSMANEPKVHTSEQQLSTISQNETKTERILNNTSTDELNAKVKESRIQITPETINILLIGIIILTLITLLIGILCRLDCCGMKTKLCRKSRRRRQQRAATIDENLRLPEEIPLNKI